MSTSLNYTVGAKGTAVYAETDPVTRRIGLSANDPKISEAAYIPISVGSTIAGAVMLADTYIDPDAANGNGTFDAPFNSFLEINRLTGNQGGKRILLKCGTTIRDMIKITNASNFTISSYGYGQLPVINAADVVALSSLTTEDTNLYSFPNGDWNFSAGSGQLGNAAWQKCVFVNGERFWLGPSLVALSAQQQVLDSSKVYFKTAASLSGTDLIEVSCRSNCIYLGGCSDFDISGIEAKNAVASNIDASGIPNSNTYARILFCKSSNAGNYTAGGLDGIVVYGVGAAGGYTPGVLIYGVESSHNKNNAIEVWGLTGAQVSRNGGHSNGQGIEVWGQTVSSQFTYNDFRNNLGTSASAGNSGYGKYGKHSVVAQGCGIWLTHYNVGGDTTTGANNDNVIAYNTIIGFDEVGIKVAGGTGNDVHQNTVVSCPTSNDVTYATWKATVQKGRPPIHVNKDANNTSVEVQNNLFLSLFDFTAYGGNGPQLAQYGSSGTINGTTFIVNADKNHYHAPYAAAGHSGGFPAGFLVMVVNNSGKSTFAAYKTACSVMTTGQEAASYNEDVLLASLPAVGDDALSSFGLTLQTISPARYNNGHPGASGLGYVADLANVSLHTTPSRGAYES